ncbi:MAG: thiolase family protein [Planctomycetota bacterium]|nr:thiolase family protein [Planctomycetota bacterium]
MFGWTVPGRRIFYGGPWIAGLIGAPGISGPMVSQACATSAAALAVAAAELESGGSRATVVITTDKCSNGPHLYHPNPKGPGGKGEAEDWVWDNFSFDPWAKNSMIETAENVAKEAGIARADMDALTQHRYEQYKAGVDSGFLKRVMLTPYEVNPSGRKVIATLEGDEGVFPTTAEGLGKLKPMLPEGTITFGSQTHPADGAAGLVVADKERAQAWSKDGDAVQLLSYGTARVEKGYMAKAVVPAARRALDSAGVGIADCKVIKTHNPFAVNDIFFAREMGIDAEAMNNNGSSLIYGHPQGPTGARLIAEGIEEARQNGGGHVLFAGCAAGDTAAAVVLKV